MKPCVSPVQDKCHLLEKHYRGKSPWKTIRYLYGPHWKSVAAAVFWFSLKNSPVWILPLLVGQVINAISHPEIHSVAEIWHIALFGTIMILINIPCHYMNVRVFSKMARRVEASLRYSICQRLQELSISFYKFKSPGVLQSKALRDVESFDQFCRHGFEHGMNATWLLLGAVIVTAIKVPLFLPFYILAIPIALLIRFSLGKRQKELQSGFRKEIESMAGNIATMIEMIPVSRAHATESTELQKIQDQLEDVKDKGLALDSHIAFYSASTWASYTLLNLFCVILGGWLSYTQILPLTAGDIVMLSQYFSQISSAASQFTNLLPVVHRGFESIRSMGEIFESPDIEKNEGKMGVKDVQGNFQFEDVQFQHPSAIQPAIKNFSCSIEAGQSIAIVGPSGSGKSTLMQLVLGFCRPDSGRILLDGRDMNDLDLRTYRRFISVVSQDVILFRGTIRENIMHGISEIPEDLLMKVVQDANAWEFIKDLPEKLETVVGQRGATLSGGQKQRIAIARALIRDPKILILDEATSALDVTSEALVQQALDRLMKGRTTFIVAHRLSTTRNAERIIVLKDGSITETGAPQDLLKSGGSYARMHAA